MNSSYHLPTKKHTILGVLLGGTIFLSATLGQQMRNVGVKYQETDNILLSIQKDNKLSFHFLQKHEEIPDKIEFIISTDPYKLDIKKSLECAHHCLLQTKYPGITQITIQDTQPTNTIHEYTRTYLGKITLPDAMTKANISDVIITHDNQRQTATIKQIRQK